MANLANFCNSEKSVKFFKIWWTRGDSNPRPPRCERGALPAELLAHEQLRNFSRGEGTLPIHCDRGCREVRARRARVLKLRCFEGLARCRSHVARTFQGG